MNLSKKLFAEFFGTAWLVFGGCGAAVLAAAFPGLGIGFVGVALAFGLTVAHHVLRHRPHLRMPPQSRRLRRPRDRPPLPLRPPRALHRRPGLRRIRRRCHPLCHRPRQARVRPRRLRLQRLWRPFAWPLHQCSPASWRRWFSPSSSSSSSWVPPTSALPKASPPRHRTRPYPHPPDRHSGRPTSP